MKKMLELGFAAALCFFMTACEYGSMFDGYMSAPSEDTTVPPQEEDDRFDETAPSSDMK